MIKIDYTTIRKVRRQKDLSQQYMAYILQISQAQYSKLETGKAIWDVDKLGETLNILELNFSEVITFFRK